MAARKLTTIRLNPADAAALARAAADGLSASELVRRGLRAVAAGYYDAALTIEPCEKARENPRYAPWLREKAAFDRLEQQLASSHRGKWIAVHKGKVIDEDSNEDTLFVRVSKKLGNAPFFIGRVDVAPEVADMPGFVVE
jgi:hypothetical protein